MELIQLDGSQGEGGGQILRTALTLSMITGKPFRIERIRAQRSKPGLLRQHLVAVRAAAQICAAQVEGAELGAHTLSFVPGKIRGGDYRYAIGSAGSCTLVLQTVLPALLFADGPATLSVTGGTHNPAAPPVDFLTRAWLPLMRHMGADIDIRLDRHGFYPAGGGVVHASVKPVVALKPLTLHERGAPLGATAIAVVAGVGGDVARRELAKAAARLGAIDQEVRALPAQEGPGNVFMIELRYAHVTELFTSFGEKGVLAEVVAERAAGEALAYRENKAATAEYLADQLVLPLALAGAGSFTTQLVSSHLLTNTQVVRAFLPVSTRIEAYEGGHRVCIEAVA